MVAMAAAECADDASRGLVVGGEIPHMCHETPREIARIRQLRIIRKGGNMAPHIESNGEMGRTTAE